MKKKTRERRWREREREKREREREKERKKVRRDKDFECPLSRAEAQCLRTLDLAQSAPVVDRLAREPSHKEDLHVLHHTQPEVAVARLLGKDNCSEMTSHKS